MVIIIICANDACFAITTFVITLLWISYTIASESRYECFSDVSMVTLFIIVNVIASESELKT